MTAGRLERAAAALVARPAVYAVVQALAGQARVAARLGSALASLAPHGPLLDVGSAEGGFASRLGLDPFFLDIDLRPLAALRRRRPRSRAAAGDATRLPCRDSAFDVSLCVAVSHHLDDGQLERVVSELARVTRGHLVFLDALRNDRRSLSRWLWRFDRGRHPRTRSELQSVLERRFRLRNPEEFTVHHQYALWIGSPLLPTAVR